MANTTDSISEKITYLPDCVDFGSDTYLPSRKKAENKLDETRVVKQNRMSISETDEENEDYGQNIKRQSGYKSPAGQLKSSGNSSSLVLSDINIPNQSADDSDSEVVFKSNGYNNHRKIEEENQIEPNKNCLFNIETVLSLDLACPQEQLINISEKELLVDKNIDALKAQDLAVPDKEQEIHENLNIKSKNQSLQENGFEIQSKDCKFQESSLNNQSEDCNLQEILQQETSIGIKSEELKLPEIRVAEKSEGANLIETVQQEKFVEEFLNLQKTIQQERSGNIKSEELQDKNNIKTSEGLDTSLLTKLEGLNLQETVQLEKSIEIKSDKLQETSSVKTFEDYNLPVTSVIKKSDLLQEIVKQEKTVDIKFEHPNLEETSVGETSDDLKLPETYLVLNLQDSVPQDKSIDIKSQVPQLPETSFVEKDPNLQETFPAEKLQETSVVNTFEDLNLQEAVQPEKSVDINSEDINLQEKQDITFDTKSELNLEESGEERTKQVDLQEKVQLNTTFDTKSELNLEQTAEERSKQVDLQEKVHLNTTFDTKSDLNLEQTGEERSKQVDLQEKVQLNTTFDTKSDLNLEQTGEERSKQVDLQEKVQLNTTFDTKSELNLEQTGEERTKEEDLEEKVQQNIVFDKKTESLEVTGEETTNQDLNLQETVEQKSEETGEEKAVSDSKSGELYLQETVQEGVSFTLKSEEENLPTSHSLDVECSQKTNLIGSNKQFSDLNAPISEIVSSSPKVTEDYIIEKSLSTQNTSKCCDNLPTFDKLISSPKSKLVPHCSLPAKILPQELQVGDQLNTEALPINTDKDNICKNQTGQTNKEQKNKMGELNDRQLQMLVSDLQLQLNAIQQDKATLELEIIQKEEIILKAQAQTQKNEQSLKQEIKQLKDKLKEKSKSSEEDRIKELENSLRQSKELEVQACSELNTRVLELANFKKVMEDYQKSVNIKLDDFEKLKEEHQTASGHLANLELAFSDVHQKYERSKAIIDAFKASEESMKFNLQCTEDKLKKNEAKYESLKTYAQSQIEKSNKEISGLREKYEIENTKLRAQIKRLEIKCSSLETSLQQKTDECSQLSELCDHITGKQV